MLIKLRKRNTVTHQKLKEKEKKKLLIEYSLFIQSIIFFHVYLQGEVEGV